MKKVFVLGCGNMPQALLSQTNNFKFYTYTPSQTRAITLAKKLNGEHIKDIEQVDWSEFDILLLGCKPQQLKEVASKIVGKLDPKIHIISMLAGVELKTQESILEHKNLTRIMPNITSAVGKGSILVYPELSKDNSEDFQFLSSNAKIYEVPTQEIFDQLMLITGSGPAYIFYLIRSLERHLEGIGLDPAKYRSAIEDTFSGALDIMKNNDELSTSDLISQVASKGGVTQEALAFFAQNNFDAMVDSAMKQGVRRSKELQSLSLS